MALIAISMSNVLLNGYVKRRAELAYARSHPEYRLHLGNVTYRLWGNRLTCRGFALESLNGWSCRVG